jgi:hypothetical protein
MIKYGYAQFFTIQNIQKNIMAKISLPERGLGKRVGNRQNQLGDC